MASRRIQIYRRRKRRRDTAKLKNKKAVRSHEGKTGMKGNMHHKKTPSTRHFKFSVHRANPPMQSFL